MSRSFNIPKQRVYDAWKLVKANKGGAGTDGVSLEKFEENLKDNLYKIWNRMTSGSYMPPPVRGVDIPKGEGKTRRLGIPTVGDRIAQAVVKLTIEPQLDPIFHEDSYGYRPGKSAHDAIEVTRKRCWQNDWLLEFDIRGMFDNIPHELIMKALGHHTQERWLLLYCDRWLTASMIGPTGEIMERTRGTPQGGVISPLLMNLFMHYAFDEWMGREFPELSWVRFADDGCVHARSRQEAEKVMERLGSRLREVGLEMHPDKTRIVYCRDANRRGDFRPDIFTFLGFDFRPRSAKSRRGTFTSFLPSVGKRQLKEMRRRIKHEFKLKRKLHWSLSAIAEMVNPVLRGWLQYYGAFCGSEMLSLWRYMNQVLCNWAVRKYKGLNRGQSNGFNLLKRAFRARPKLFVHWKFARP